MPGYGQFVHPFSLQLHTRFGIRLVVHVNWIGYFLAHLCKLPKEGWYIKYNQVIYCPDFAQSQFCLIQRLLVPKKYFRKFLPSHETFKQSRWARWFGGWLHHPNLWHLNRHSVSGGVAVGLFTGLIPGPLQIIGAALLAVLFRVNLPVAAVITLYTNPLTIVPLYALAYELGVFVTGHNNGRSSVNLSLPEMTWVNWPAVMLDWIVSLGKPLAVGLPLLALIFAIVGYFSVRMLWYAIVVWEWRKRASRRR